MNAPLRNDFNIRTATPADAEAIAGVLRGIAAEQIYSAIVQPWSPDEQRSYLRALSPREVFQIAESSDGSAIGYQSLELYARVFESMAHVGQIGTFLQPEWRRRGVGEALFRANLSFAQAHRYEKFVIQVRGSNTGAHAFYTRLGFRECGRLSRQVRIGDREDDEVIMEFFL